MYITELTLHFLIKKPMAGNVKRIRQQATAYYNECLLREFLILKIMSRHTSEDLFVENVNLDIDWALATNDTEKLHRIVMMLLIAYLNFDELEEVLWRIIGRFANNPDKDGVFEKYLFAGIETILWGGPLFDNIDAQKTQELKLYKAWRAWVIQNRQTAKPVADF